MQRLIRQESISHLLAVQAALVMGATLQGWKNLLSHRFH